jgi:protein-L-isoaspartate O-methyltransferase
MQLATQRNGPDWASYYEALPSDLDQTPKEATDYVTRLTRIVALRPEMDVLDFGCGLGFVTALIAPLVQSVYVWDNVERMRRCAVERARKSGRVRILDWPGSTRAPATTFDLVLVNSVVQYMSERELASWMAAWRGLLKIGGIVVLSDVIPPDSTFAKEVRDTIWFAFRSRVLFRDPRKLFKEYQRYSQTRRLAPMLRLTSERVQELGHEAGLEARRLPTNLTFRTNRLSFILSSID